MPYFFGMDAVTSFWLANIFTRPLGASIGDLLSQPTDYGSLGFGTIYTSLAFVAAIAANVGINSRRLAGNGISEMV